MSNPTFEVVLEKKGRGRGAFSLSRPWAVRNFKLTAQSLEYYEKTKLKGTIDINKAKVYDIPPSEADEKAFPFVVETGGEKLFLNATSDANRKVCLQIFTRAAEDKNWQMPTANETAAEDAAMTAAVAIFKENVEVAKLEAEVAKLEEERKVEVTDSTAAIFEEELVKKKLREAEEAEAKQREEQERQVMELLKSLGVKQRFLAAVKNNRMDIAKDCAAMMLQGVWRAKQARRRMLKQKEHKEKLRNEAYARKIQARYRQRLANRRVQAIKKEKQAIKERIAAIKVQGRWRMHIARKTYRRKEDEKLANEYSKSINKLRGLIKFQTAVRRFLAFAKLQRLRKVLPTVGFVTIDKLEGYQFPTVGYVDLNVYVSGCVLVFNDVNSSGKAEDTVKLHRHPANELIRKYGKITSNFKVDMNASSSKMGIVTSLHAMDYIIVTAVDRNNDNELLGQAIIKIKDVVDVVKMTGSNKVDVTTKFQDSLVIPIVDENNQPLTTYKKPTTGNGNIFVTISDPNYTMCGWLYKLSESLLSINAWKKRWFVLADGYFSYYNSDLHLDSSKNIINCNDITSITVINDGTSNPITRGRSNCLRIVYQSNNVENDWVISFDDEETSKMIQSMWLRKLHRNASKVTYDTEGLLYSSKRASSSSSAKTTQDTNDSGKLKPRVRRHQSIYFENTGEKGTKTKVPVAKRMSIFK